MRSHDWECGPIITASEPAPRNRGGRRSRSVPILHIGSPGTVEQRIPPEFRGPVPFDALKNVEPSFAALRWCHGPDVRHWGHWKRKASSNDAQVQLPMRDGPASTRCAETFYRRGKGSLAIARSAAVWARHCGQSMNRTSCRTFPSISRICSNGWTNANGVRAGPRPVRPALLEDHGPLPRTLGVPARRPAHCWSGIHFPNRREATLPPALPTAERGWLRARYRSCWWARGRR